MSAFGSGEITGTLHALGIDGYTLHITRPGYHIRRNPNASENGKKVSIRVTVIGRNDFHKLARHYNAKVTERAMQHGVRGWWAEADNPDRRLLIEGVSFRHHDDWEAKP